MEANKILFANILDLIFDDRNKEYGAYELRVTYPERVKKSLIIVFVITAIAIAGAALANSMEEEAISVLKKATKWEPAIRNGHAVKAYRVQPITFEVEESN